MVKYGMEPSSPVAWKIHRNLQRKCGKERNYVEHKGNTYYDDPKDKTAFERCIDIMSRLILKYGPGMLEELEREKREKAQKAHCEETNNVLRYIHRNAWRNGNVNIANRITEIRKEAGENRKEFSQHTGIPVRTLEDWEVVIIRRFFAKTICGRIFDRKLRCLTMLIASNSRQLKNL